MRLRVKERGKLEEEQRETRNLKVTRRANPKVSMDTMLRLRAPAPAQKPNGTRLLPTGPLEPLRKVRKSRLDLSN